MEPKFRNALACLITAAFCGLIGFLVIYYYATLERPMKHFAIVIDAGSTQTRSGLFTIIVDNQALAEWTDSEEIEDGHDDQVSNGNNVSRALLKSEDHHYYSKHRRRPLSKILQVRQVSGCVNGGPLASIKTEEEARELVRKCLTKFVNHIKELDFVEVTSAGLSSTHSDDDEDENEGNDYDDLDGLDSEEVSKQLAMMNHRVNSVTHLYLGATAGMRSLNKINSKFAKERLTWIDRALNETGSLIQNESGSPYINKGFVGIIPGSDEAAFGWVSVNFVCDNLVPMPVDHLRQHQNDQLLTYPYKDPNEQYNVMLESIGTLELGGASTQMAFLAPKAMDGKQLKQIGFIERTVELFNANYRLATRSDLCLGMSQAVLRANYVLIRDYFQQNHAKGQQLSDGQASPSSITINIEIENPCIQNGAKLHFKGQQLQQIWQGSCLLASPDDLTANVFFNKLTSNNNNKTTSLFNVILRGIGNVEQCSKLLSILIEPIECRKYFSLCPSSKNKQAPLDGMPFVTMSGYNHALNVLDLQLSKPLNDDNSGQSTLIRNRQHLMQIIVDKLGGSSVNFTEFLLKTQVFCSTPINELGAIFSKVSKPYENIICLQLIYIRKLLTEFYLFDPSTNWHQIKFLLSNPSQEALPTVAGKKLDVRRDIGWTLGLLLNATSNRLSHESEEEYNGTIFFHHGSTIFYVLRTALLISFACCLFAICALVVIIYGVRRAQQGGAYINHS